MPRLKEEIATLKNQDTYSLMLFVLFKLRDIPEYSTLSELIYVLKKEEFLKLCEYFGGLTLKIPTIEEMETLTHSLILYMYVNVDGMNFDDALKLIDCKDFREKNRIKEDYKKIVSILDKYTLVKWHDSKTT